MLSVLGGVVTSCVGVCMVISSQVCIIAVYIYIYIYVSCVHFRATDCVWRVRLYLIEVGCLFICL